MVNRLNESQVRDHRRHGLFAIRLGNLEIKLSAGQVVVFNASELKAPVTHGDDRDVPPKPAAYWVKPGQNPVVMIASETYRGQMPKDACPLNGDGDYLHIALVGQGSRLSARAVYRTRPRPSA